MILEALVWGMATSVIGFLVISFNGCVSAAMYTRCNSPNSDVYEPQPIFSGTCITLSEAAAQCLKMPLCDLISKTDTDCSYHTAINRTLTCDNGNISGDISWTTFKPCNCALNSDVWVRVGSFYLYVTLETYYCNQGQDACIALGGNMAEFYNTEELNYALTYITESVFVGGYRMNDKYYWRTTDQEIEASLWVPGQPELLNSCVQIWRSNQGLDDTSSTYLKPVLCQKRIQ